MELICGKWMGSHSVMNQMKFKDFAIIGGMPLHVWLNDENVPEYLAIDGGFNKYFRNAIWE